ncbi:hypothetical protein OVA24_12540 [Luteolibacter sp. SL250]|uniref:hypothetical protein n=1 Tax=Luteolibacter sp. SL250 TaxID=2995170 RepID=UPI00226DB562|nr:hypothetical protein [Luteolibacter sp. SL250]WAC18065.1 hypothetical protein OVA24_12540 [Luteolibacter sp. SL250]
MKTRQISLFIITLLVSQAEAVDFVRQIQLINGRTVVYDTPIAQKNGTVRSKPLEGDGAIFQLYAYQDPVFSPFTLLDAAVGTAVRANVSLSSNLIDLTVLGIHLDINLGSDPAGSSLPQLLAEQTVGAYIPEARISLTSADPYFPPRTRADQPFAASVAVGRLPTDTDNLPEGVPTKVTMARSYKLYERTLHIPAENGTGQGTYDQGFEFSKNGTFSLPGIYQNLPGEFPTKAMGEESFTATVKLGDARATVGSATIQIWPVCTAVIEGIEPGKTYQEAPPEARVTLTDLYPDSVTYAQIYRGPPALGTTGTKLPSSAFSINTFAPQNAVVPLADIADGFGEDGTYTIEVLTITPFNHRQPERIAYVSFELKRTISVRAMSATME